MNALESTLRRHDRIALAERRKRNVIDSLTFGSGCRCCYDTNDGGEYTALIDLRKQKEVMKKNEQEGEEEEENDNHKNDDSDSDSDSEFDYLLDEELPGGGNDNDYTNGEDDQLKLLQQERLEELQLSAMIRASAMQHGFGAHRQFHPQRVLHAAGLGLEGTKLSSSVAAIPPAAVIHLNEDSMLSASLDLCLEELAMNTYRGTKFLRSYGRSTLSFNRDLVQKVLPSLKIDSSLPALIAVKNGDVVSICENLSLFAGRNDDHVEPRAVEEWLDRAGVLLYEVPIAYEDYCRIRPEEDALLENMMREKLKLSQMKAEEEIFECGVAGCEKTFYHEHVGVKNDQQSGLVVSEDAVLS